MKGKLSSLITHHSAFITAKVATRPARPRRLAGEAAHSPRDQATAPVINPLILSLALLEFKTSPCSFPCAQRRHFKAAENPTRRLTSEQCVERAEKYKEGKSKKAMKKAKVKRQKAKVKTKGSRLVFFLPFAFLLLP